MVNGKRKGKDGETELKHALNAHGYNTRRSVQYCGANGDADLVGLDGIHIECKRVEQLSVYKAMEQAKNDARKDELPVVMHRRNRSKWLAIMELDDWMELYKAWEKENGKEI